MAHGRSGNVPVQRRALGKMLRPLWDAATAQGWRVELTGANHVRWLSPDPEAAPIVTALTPSSQRTMLNVRAQLRRAGLKV